MLACIFAAAEQSLPRSQRLRERLALTYLMGWNLFRVTPEELGRLYDRAGLVPASCRGHVHPLRVSRLDAWNEYEEFELGSEVQLIGLGIRPLAHSERS